MELFLQLRKRKVVSRMNDEETMNDLLRTLNDHLGDIHTELIGIREACEKANKEQMKSEEFAMGMVGGITEKLREITLEAEGKKVVELVDEEKVGDRAEKIVAAAVAILTAESCPECSDYAVSEKGDKHMCRRSEPEGRYIPGSFIIEGTIPDWCPFSLGTKEEEEES